MNQKTAEQLQAERTEQKRRRELIKQAHEKDRDYMEYRKYVKWRQRR